MPLAKIVLAHQAVTNDRVPGGDAIPDPQQHGHELRRQAAVPGQLRRHPWPDLAGLRPSRFLPRRLQPVRIRAAPHVESLLGPSCIVGEDGLIAFGPGARPSHHLLHRSRLTTPDVDLRLPRERGCRPPVSAPDGIVPLGFKRAMVHAQRQARPFKRTVLVPRPQRPPLL
ncbi:hypothetical protein [Bradyrhizobium sp. SZCCHNS2002]|uniref:hypothetical protein n=1 Tax=Bradyrhizobium sp. SZCCHNS2002 TaxID=3057302 RepID=UPI0029165D77|nr:hypothetical protein [Bradyrhizobium sp. SZCCHNS2002]